MAHTGNPTNSNERAQNGHQSGFLGGMARKEPVLLGLAVRPLWSICGPNCVSLGWPSYIEGHASLAPVHGLYIVRFLKGGVEREDTRGAGDEQGAR